jgi:hypothetical protein
MDWGQVAKGQAWQAQLDRAFGRLDKNSDGFISLDEIMGELPMAAFAGSTDPESSRVAEVGGRCRLCCWFVVVVACGCLCWLCVRCWLCGCLCWLCVRCCALQNGGGAACVGLLVSGGAVELWSSCDSPPSRLVSLAPWNTCGACVLTLTQALLTWPAPGMTHAHPPTHTSPPPQAKKMLREADANGDGKISREEFTQLLASSVVPDSLSFYDTRLGDSTSSGGSTDVNDVSEAQEVAASR